MRKQKRSIISAMLFKPGTTESPQVIKTVDDLNAIYPLIGNGCKGIEIYGRLIGGKYYLIFCDEIGRYKELPISAINSEGTIMFVGNLIITGMTKDGDVKSLTDEDTERIRDNLVSVKSGWILHCEY